MPQIGDGDTGKNEESNFLETTKTTTTTIRSFYSDGQVFVTGGTGFVGKLLIEKLLRSCPCLRKIYVLIRPKRGKNAQERLEELLNNRAFDILKKINPGALGKIHLIKGDVGEENLGINDVDIDTLLENVTVVFHCAATIKFTEHLSDTLLLNTLGTKRMAELCCKMKRIKAFVYVSTAYCNVDKRSVIEETIYEPSCDPKALLELLGNSPNVLNQLTHQYCESHPNTYTFSKALSEYILLDYASRLRIAIVRPSMVSCSWKEPIPGWIDGLSLITGVVVEVCQGFCNSFLCDKDAVLDLIPVDVVVNTLITAAWNLCQPTAIDHNNTPITVYNCTSGGMTCERIIKLVETYGREFPTNSTMFYPSVTFTKRHKLHKMIVFSTRLLPGCLWDLLMGLVKKTRPPKVLPLMRKMTRASDVRSYFVLHGWRFECENMARLDGAIRATSDGRLFAIDVGGGGQQRFSWPAYLKEFVLGVRLHVLKEDHETLGRARRRLSKIYWTTLTVKLVLVYLLLNVLMMVFT